MPSKSFSKKYGARLAERDGMTYHYCGVKLLPFDVKSFPTNNEIQFAQVDHVIPRSLGGTDDLSNLVLCCPPCNVRKGARYTYDEFIALQERRMKAKGLAS